MSNETMTLKVIAHIHTAFPTKFGIPRQSGLVDGLRGEIIFTPEYRNADALRGLAADADDVTIADGGGHAAAVAGQGKVGVPCGRNADVAFDVLFGGDGGAAGNAAHQRHPHHFGQGLKPRRDKRSVFQPHQPCGGGLQCSGKLLHLGLRDVVDPFFQLGDGGFGAVAHPLGKLFLREPQLEPTL